MKYGSVIGKGLYDPGANASTISLCALKKHKDYKFIPVQSTYNTTSGSGTLLGITMLDITIMNISRRVMLHVLDSPTFSFDFIIALDLIPFFRLALDENLVLTQRNIDKVPYSSHGTFINHNVIWNDYFSLDLFNSKMNHLDSNHKNVISSLIRKNHFAFARHKFDVGNVTDYECSINLASNNYIAKKPYRCCFEDQEEIEKQCSELLKHNMIAISSSPYASPVTMQFKKDGLDAKKVKTRMCVDYRDLNKQIIPECQPFPLIDEILIKARGCSWFSALDINAAFHSIPIRKGDRYKSAFITQHGHYEWRCMPFGLKVSPAVFQRILSSILKKHNLSQFAINYLDDILIFSRSFEEHINHLQLVISAIYAEGFRLNFKKCSFAKPSIQYLGHILGPNTVQPLHDNLTAISNFPTPKSRKNIRQFLGKVNFYRKFIPKSASLLEPFHNLLRKNIPFSWSPACQAAFEKVKNLLTSAPILAIFDRTRPILIYTDASGVGVGAVLKQIQDDGMQKPVAFFSKKLSDAQKKKKAIYIESLAVREAIRYWRYWLIGRRFTVYTDHKPLQHMNLKARPDEELGDLANELLQFDFEILYKPGSSNSEADCLSRNPVLESSDSNFTEPILPTFYFLSHNDILSMQRNVEKVESDVIENGIIYRKVRNRTRILLDSDTGKTLIKNIHDKYGHIGTKHIILLLTQYFIFPNMYRLIKEFCASCTVCLQNKSRRPTHSARLGILGPATKPFQIMSLDTVGGFRNCNSSSSYLHILIDHFTRYVFILCSTGQTAKILISLVHFVHKNNPIETLLTDQYGGLSSNEFSKYCSDSNITHVFTAVDSAFSNGLNERLGQTLVNRIRCAKNDPSTPPNQSWTKIAHDCVKQYNNSPHSVTSFSPSYLLHGNNTSVLPDSLSSSADIIRDRKIAFDKSNKYHLYNKRIYDSHNKDVTFQVGDFVFVDNGNKLNRDKLDKLRIGPFEITRKLSNNVFQLKVHNGYLGKKLYHASKLLPVVTFS